jgi:photosystem II stability/assembly factor-like uncharacterized protein
MSKKQIGLAMCILGVGLVAALVWRVPAARGGTSPLSAPTLAAVSPSEAPNNLDVTITLTGTGFQAVPAVRLGDSALPAVGWVSSTSLTATVPWGLDPGVYTVTVTNPDGGAAWLAEAFTATQGIGVWTTEGPYGGEISDLAVSPVVSTTACAFARNAGLFRTQNGGDSWELVFYDDGYDAGVVYGSLPTATLYYWGNPGVWQSDDDGDTWQQVTPAKGRALALDPGEERRIWTATEDGVRLSPDGGTTWVDRTANLPTWAEDNVWPTILAIRPGNSSVVYAGMSNGHLFKTVNEGEQWEDLTAGLYPPAESLIHPVMAVAISPFSPDTVLFSRWGAVAYRSTDRGETWTEIAVGPEEDSRLTDIAFSPNVSGTVYVNPSGMELLAVSTDGGATWTPFGKRQEDYMVSIGMDPASGRPVYLGSSSTGPWTSPDGGQTWEIANKGITGLRVRDISASPGHPEYVYIAARTAGAYMSSDAGRSWRHLISEKNIEAVAASPEQATRVHLAGGDLAYHNPQGNDTWIEGVLTDTMAQEIAVSPVSPSRVYVGGLAREAAFEDRIIGKVFRSEDYGLHWTEVYASDPVSISNITDLAVHPVDSQTLYLTASHYDNESSDDPGNGIFRSADGGESWEHLVNGTENQPMASLAIDAAVPQVLYAGGWYSDEMRSTVFVSLDGGESWQPTDLYRYFEYSEWAWVMALAVDPLPPHTVYAGSEVGLFASEDRGATWWRVGGELGHVNVQALDIASDGERSILYVGTIGGVMEAGMSGQRAEESPSAEGFVEGGVYQLTVDHRTRPVYVYLPVVAKGE